MHRKQVERGLLLLTFFLFIFISFTLYDRFQYHDDLCSQVATGCSYELFLDGCFCNGERIDVEFMIYSFSGGEKVMIHWPEINASAILLAHNSDI